MTTLSAKTLPLTPKILFVLLLDFSVFPLCALLLRSVPELRENSVFLALNLLTNLRSPPQTSSIYIHPSPVHTFPPILCQMKTIQWGILGCGDVTERKSGPALQKIPGSRLVAVMRRDSEKAADYARRHQVPFWTNDVDTLIHHPEVNAVYIATPPGSHTELALKVAAAGKPCYVEKSMAANAAEARSMAAAFSTTGVPLYVAYYRRALARFVFVKEMIDSGSLGRLIEIRYRYSAPLQTGGWRHDSQMSGGGLFADLGSHALDLFDYWTGPLTHIQSWNRRDPSRPAVAEQIGLLFACPNGVAGSATWNFACSQKEDRVELFGSEAVLSFSLFGHEPFRWSKASGTAEERAFPIPEHIQEPLLRQVILALQIGSACSSTAASALRTEELLDLILPERQLSDSSSSSSSIKIDH